MSCDRCLGTETNGIDDWITLTNTIQDEASATRLGIPVIYGVDAVHGHNNVIGATIFPHNIGLGATRDAALVKEVGAAVATEVKATGVSWTFAPCLAVPQDSRWGRTYEGFGENVDLVSQLGVAYTQGLQGDTLDEFNDTNKVVSTVKHFIGEGATEGGVNQGNVDMTDEEVLALYLKPYEEAVNAGARTIMVSYNSINGLKCHGNENILTNVLKGDLQFNGFVVSDWDGINQLPGDFKEQIKTYVNAGMDMFMVPHNWKNFLTELKELVHNPEVTTARIDDAVTRILRVKVEAGMMKENNVKADASLYDSFGSTQNKLIAREAVRKSLVLLKNEDHICNQLDTMDHIFVAGKSANDIGLQTGGWTVSWQGKSDGDMGSGLPIGPSTPGTTIWQGIQEVILGSATSTYETDVAVPRKSEVIEKNGKILKYDMFGRGATDEFDVAVVVVGEKPYAESNGDNGTLELDEKDIATLENIQTENPDLPIIVVLISGRPMIISDYVDDWDGLVAAWLPGTEGAGVADVLFNNQYDFTGKLPISWPWYVEQLPLGSQDDAMFSYGYGLTKTTHLKLPVKPNKPLPTPFDISNRIESEDAIFYSSMSTENTTDEGGGENVGWNDAGKWYDYYIHIPTTGLYTIDFRVASPDGASNAIAVLDEKGNEISHLITVPQTGGWQNWETVTGQAAFESGNHLIRIKVKESGWNFNWMMFRREGEIPLDWSIGEGESDPIMIPSSPVLREDGVDVWFSSESKYPGARSWYYAPKEIAYTLDKQENMDLVLPTSNWDVETIVVDPKTTYQTILGIGTSLEEASIYNLYKMSEEARDEVLTKLVGTDVNNDEANMRLTVGAADFTGREFYTYADIPYDMMPRDESEAYYMEWLEDNFSIQKDVDYHIIETIKKVQEINPNVKFFSSSWTPPGWMKSVNKDFYFNPYNLKAGRLEDKFIPVLAKYYVLYVEAYAELGIDIYAMTLQNEPELEIDYPSCGMTAAQEQALAEAMVEEFKVSVSAGRLTESQVPKIWAFDHNFSSAVSFLGEILDSPAIDGGAYHDYSGSPTTMSTVHDMFPDKSANLTERSLWGTHGADRIAQYFRNYAESYNAWVTMLDSNIYPEQWVGEPDPTMFIKDSGKDSTDNEQYWAAPEFYMMAQYTQFVPPGSIRIDSDYGSKETVTNVSFLRPDGKVASIMINQNKNEQAFKLLCNGEQISGKLPGGTVATYVWMPGEGDTIIEPLLIKESIKPGVNAINHQGMTVNENDLANADTGDFVEFFVDIPVDGYYYFDLDFSNSDTGEVSVLENDVQVGTLKLQQCSQWAPWMKSRAKVYLTEGHQMVKLQVVNGVDFTLGTINVYQSEMKMMIPGRIEAENYSGGDPVHTGSDVSYFDPGEKLTYDIQVTTSSSLTIQLGYSTGNDGAKVKLSYDDTILSITDLPKTEWWGYNVVEDQVNVKATTNSVLTIEVVDAGFNLDYVDIGPVVLVDDSSDEILEGEEDGKTVSLKASNIEGMSVHYQELELDGAPSGILITSITEEVIDSTTQAAVVLSVSDKTDYDVDQFVKFKVPIVSETNTYISTAVKKFTAIDDVESITGAWTYEGDQAKMDEEVVTMTLAGGTFIEDSISDITLADNTSGITIESIDYLDSTHVKVNLAWNGTTYYEDSTLLFNIPVTAYDDSTGDDALTVEMISSGVTGSVVENYGVIQGDEVYMMNGGQLEEKTIRDQSVMTIGSLGTGDKVSYKVNVPEAGRYHVTFVLNNVSGFNADIEDSNGEKLALLNLPQVWASWFKVRRAVELEAGEQIITLNIKAGNDFEIGWMDYQPEPTAQLLPSRIEAESYVDATKGVIEGTEIGENTAYNHAGDTLTYYVRVEEAGTYEITYHYATPQAGVKGILKKDDQVLATTDFLSTSGWGDYKDVTDQLTLEAGTYDLVLEDVGDGFNLDWIEFTIVEAPVEDPIEPIDQNNNNDDDNDDDDDDNNNDNNNKKNKSIIKSDTGTVIVPIIPQLDKATGIAQSELSESELLDYMDNTQRNEQGLKVVLIDVEEVEGATAYGQTLPVSLLQNESKDEAITVKTEFANVTLCGEMLANTEIKEDRIILVVEQMDGSSLDTENQAFVKDRPVIDLRFVDANDNLISWSNTATPVSVEIDYEPTQEELQNPEHIIVYHINAQGELKAIPNRKYDIKSKTVKFTTTHFSLYTIGYHVKTFKDLSDFEWARKSIEVLASKGIINGTSEETFDPGMDISRADFIKLLVNTLELTSDVKENFSDVDSNAYYYEEVSVAKALSIAKGNGKHQFNPTNKITREDMMTLMARALEKKGQLSLDTTLSTQNFEDMDKIASYAQDSVAALIEAQLVHGNGDKINPKGLSKRAEVAAILYRIIHMD